MILGHLRPRHRPRQPDRIHRIDIRPKDDAVEVPDDNSQRCKPSLVIMDNARQINHQKGPALQYTSLEPHEQPCAGHDGSSPYDRPVLQLLHVRKAVETGPVASQTQVKGYHFTRFAEVAPAGLYQPELSPTALCAEQIRQMIHGR